MTTAVAPIATIRRAASLRSSSVRISILVSASASGNIRSHEKGLADQFGFHGAQRLVVQQPVAALGDHHGIDDEQRDLEIAYGRGDTASTIAAFASMPVLAACTPKSETTASIWAVTRSAGSASAIVTPSEFCAVTAVMALSAIHAVRGERLEVSLDARARAGIAARDCQRDAHRASAIGRADATAPERVRRRWRA